MLDVVRINGIIEEGVTEPIRCVLSDGSDAIVKYPRNRFGIEVLVNEWIGNSIADAINLTIPAFGICNLSKEIILRDRETDELSEENSGVCFYSRYIKKTVPITEKLLENVDNKDIERLILFDLITNDHDRHNGNIICSIVPSTKLYFIDCSHIFTNDGHNMNKRLDLNKELSRPQLTNIDLIIDEDGIYDKLCRFVGFDPETLCLESKHIKETLSQERLKEVFDSIPPEWIVDSVKTRAIDMMEIMNRKISMLESIAESIIEERKR